MVAKSPDLVSETVTNTFEIRNRLHTLSSISFLSPGSGIIVDGLVLISWSPSVDSWGLAVTYSVFYSNDSGTSWNPLAENLITEMCC